MAQGFIPLADQMRFMWQELQGPEARTLQAFNQRASQGGVLGSAADYATIFDQQYERSGGARDAEARAYANEVFGAVGTDAFENLPSNAKFAYSFLTQKGLTPEQAAGITGRLMVESYAHVDPNARNTIGGGAGTYGIAQWRGPRLEALANYAGVSMDDIRNLPISTPEGNYYQTRSIGQTQGAGPVGYFDTQPDQQTGLLGGLFGNDSRTREQKFADAATAIAIGANQLRMRPSESFAQSLQQQLSGRIAERKALQQSNRTAEWLAQQPGGVSYAKLILTDPSLAAQALASWQAKQAGAAPTAAMQNYEFLLSQGLSPEDAVGRAFSAGTTINMPGQAPAEDALREKLMQKRGETWASMIDAGTASAASMADLNVLQELAPLAPSGALSGRIAQAFPEFNDVAALRESIVKRVAPTLRVEGSGSTSDIEFAAMLNSLGSLRNTPEANMAIIGLMQTKAQFNIDRANIIRQYSTGTLSYDEANKQIMEIEQKARIPSQVQSIIDRYTEDTSEASSPDVVTDSAGIKWKYKGTGDRNDQANYERID